MRLQRWLPDPATRAPYPWLSGYRVSLGLPREGDVVGVWGHSPTAHRGEAMAAKYDIPIVRIEDAFLRSLHPGRAGKSAPLGLMIDRKAMHFDPKTPSELETLLATHPLMTRHC